VERNRQLSVSDPYKVLQVDPEAEDEVIEAAYRRLARKYHPDVSPDPESHAKMIAINKAWEVLRDPAKRAAVNRARQRSTGTAAWVASADAQVRAAAPSATPMRQPPPGPPSTSVSTQPADAVPTSGAWPFGMHDPGASAPQPAGPRPVQNPRDSWATGRIPIGGFQSGASSRPDGEGAAGPPPGHPSGSVLNFGRFAGWSLGEIARVEIEYLEWLDRMPIGRTYQNEIDELLRAGGRRATKSAANEGRGGPFRRR
jgi:hypothetical protein